MSSIYKIYILKPDDDGFEVEELVDEEGIYKKHNFNCNFKWNLTKGDISPFHSQDYRSMLEEIINKFEIDIIHIHHLIGHTFDVVDVAEEHDIPALFTIHDFYSICPRINLLDDSLQYCYNRDPKRCAECLSDLKVDAEFIPHWRSEFQRIFNNSDTIIFPNAYASVILASYYDIDRSKLEAVEHGYDRALIEYGRKIDNQADFASDEEINIAYIGVLAPHKGEEIFYELARSSYNKKINWFIIGISTKFSEPGYYPEYNINITGFFKDEKELFDTLKARRIHLAAFPALWQETYSYTLSEAWIAGIPVIASDLGALKERVERKGGGWTASPNAASFKDRIEEVLSDPEMYQAVKDQIGTIEHKTLEDMALEYSRLYAESLISKMERRASTLGVVLSERDCRIAELSCELAEAGERVKSLEMAASERDERIAELSGEVKEANAEARSLELVVSERDGRITELDEHLKHSESRIRQLENEIAEMKRAIVWQLAMKYHNRIVERSLHQGTKQRNLYDLGIKGGRILVNEGFRCFWDASTHYIRNGMSNQIQMPGSKMAVEGRIDLFEHKKSSSELYNNIKYTPKMSIIMPTWNSEEKWLRRAIESVKNQIYDNWELCIADGGSTKSDTKKVLQEYANSDPRIILNYLSENMNISGNSNQALNLASGEFVGFLDHDDELTPDALIENVKLLNLHPEADLIYSDHAKIDEYGVVYDQEFKPDWSPELLLSYCYIGHLKIIRKTLVDEVGGFRSQFDGSQDYDLLLRVTEKTENVYHIPEILYLWRATKKSLAQSACSKPYSIERGRMAVEDALKRRGICGEVSVPDFALKNKLGIYEIKFSIKYRELVTIIIPTKDNVELLKRCVDSIEAKTTYDDYEILILDNGSEKKETRNFFESLINKYRIIKVITEGFNFSELVNFGVSQAKGDIIVLLNDDTEVITPSWIEDMLGWIQSDDKIGAVGCKLIYGDGSIQHAGVVLGMCSHPADHAFKLRHYKDGGYLNYANVVRNYSAVTAACLMTKKSAFNQIGGFDDENLPISFNDVDYCLRLIENDFRVVYTPKAMLYHHEGKSRGIGEQIDRPQEIELFESKWGGLVFEDRFYNKNLSLSGHDFKFKSNDRVLLISHNLNTEGAPILMFNLGKQLKSKGYEVAVVSPHDGALKKDYSQHRIKSYIHESDNILQFIEYYKPKVALVNTIVSFKYIKILKSCGIRIIWILHESERDLYFRDLRGLNELPFEIADSVVFVSDATRNIYEDLNKTKTFVTIHNGIDLSEIEEFIKNNDKKVLRSQLGYPENALIITTVGTVCPRKDQETFVKAAVDILSDSAFGDDELYFLVVGANEDGTPMERLYLKKIKKYIEETCYNKHINIVYRSEIPERSDVLKYYMISDIYVCASAIEAFPITILEAMSFSMPVVSTDVFGIKEQIVDNETGFFFNLGDYRDLSRKLVTLKDQEVRKTLGEASFSKLKKEFTIEKMTNEYEKLIISLNNF